jgi:hypothetical protein
MKRNGLPFFLVAALAGWSVPVQAQPSPPAAGKMANGELPSKPPPKQLLKPVPKYSKTVSYAIPGPGGLALDGVTFQIIANNVSLADVGTAVMSLGMAQGGTVWLSSRGTTGLTGPVGIAFTLLAAGSTGNTEVFEIQVNGSVVATCNAKVVFNQATQCRADVNANGPMKIQLRGVSSGASQFYLQSIFLSH